MVRMHISALNLDNVWQQHEHLFDAGKPVVRRFELSSEAPPVQSLSDIVTSTLWHLLVFLLDIVTIFPIPKSQFQYCSLIALWLLVSKFIGYCDYFPNSQKPISVQ